MDLVKCRRHPLLLLPQVEALFLADQLARRSVRAPFSVALIHRVRSAHRHLEEVLLYLVKASLARRRRSLHRRLPVAIYSPILLPRHSSRNRRHLAVVEAPSLAHRHRLQQRQHREDRSLVAAPPAALDLAPSRSHHQPRVALDLPKPAAVDQWPRRALVRRNRRRSSSRRRVDLGPSPCLAERRPSERVPPLAGHPLSGVPRVSVALAAAPIL